MAFPLTHLLIADYLLKHTKLVSNDSAFLLGSIAPDAVHYRVGFQGAAMANIGASKKISHLCPISDERWGQVTDNTGWEKCVVDFLHAHPNDPFCAGYATHVLTDIFNNIGIWSRFRTKYPDEAAKGYASDYYRDLNNIDIQLYHRLYRSSGIESRLADAIARDVPGLVTAEEIYAIRDNLLHDYYKDATVLPQEAPYTFVTYDEVIQFIKDAAEYSANVLSTSLSNGA